MNAMPPVRDVRGGGGLAAGMPAAEFLGEETTWQRARAYIEQADSNPGAPFRAAAICAYRQDCRSPDVAAPLAGREWEPGPRLVPGVSGGLPGWAPARSRRPWRWRLAACARPLPAGSPAPA